MMSKPKKIGEPPLPYEMIWSCNICSATISEIYADQNHGIEEIFEYGSDQHFSKLWVSECGHVFCGKHLEGGGVPFHPVEELPKAPCPYCTVEQNHSTPVSLHAVRGFSNGRWDTSIPQNWFETPPVNLLAEGKEMDALRFQYLSLIRYGTNIYRRLKKAQEDLRSLTIKSHNDEITLQTLQDEVSTLSARIIDLEKCKVDVEAWKRREPKIRHYLGILTDISRENEKLREQLMTLGYAVPVRKFSIENDRSSSGRPAESPSAKLRQTTAKFSNLENDDCTEVHVVSANEEVRPTGTSSSRTLSGPARGNIQVIDLEDSSDPNMEIRTPKPSNNHSDPEYLPTHKLSSNEFAHQQGRSDSSRLMPPPPIPAKRRAENLSNTLGSPQTISVNVLANENRFPSEFENSLWLRSNDRDYQHTKSPISRIGQVIPNVPDAENTDSYQYGEMHSWLDSSELPYQPKYHEVELQGSINDQKFRENQDQKSRIAKPVEMISMCPESQDNWNTAREPHADVVISSPNRITHNTKTDVNYVGRSLQDEAYTASKMPELISFQKRQSQIFQSAPIQVQDTKASEGEREQALLVDSMPKSYGDFSMSRIPRAYVSRNQRLPTTPSFFSGRTFPPGPTTPSPVKQFNPSESVASPYFSKSKPSVYRGPIRLSERLSSSQLVSCTSDLDSQMRRRVGNDVQSSPLQSRSIGQEERFPSNHFHLVTPGRDGRYYHGREIITPGLTARSIKRDHNGFFRRLIDQSDYTDQITWHNTPSTRFITNSNNPRLSRKLPRVTRSHFDGSMSGISRPSQEFSRQRDRMYEEDFINQTGYLFTSGRRTARR